MARIRKRRLGPKTGFTTVDTSNGTFIPMEDWQPAADHGKVRMTWEAAESTVANMVTKPGYQLADVRDTPLSPEVLGTDSKTGNGTKFGSSFVAIASTTQAHQYLRAGIWVKNPTDTTTLNLLLLWLEVEIEDD